jgi:hypothetical protein
MIDKLLNSGVDWLENSKIPTLMGALFVMAFAVWHIWQEVKRK